MIVRNTLFGALLMLICVASARAQTATTLELERLLRQELKVNPTQARGGAGSLFSLAKSRLNPDEFEKVRAAVPGMDSMINFAPRTEYSVFSSTLSQQFKALGLSPDMEAKFALVMTRFVSEKGGGEIGSLLAGALK